MACPMLDYLVFWEYLVTWCQHRSILSLDISLNSRVRCPSRAKIGVFRCDGPKTLVSWCPDKIILSLDVKRNSATKRESCPGCNQWATDHKKPEFVDTANQRAAGGNSDSTSKQCADMVVKTFPGIHWYGRSCRKTSVVLSHQTQVQTGGHERKFSKHQAPVKWSS